MTYSGLGTTSSRFMTSSLLDGVSSAAAEFRLARISTLDLLDGGFVLLTGGEGAVWCAAASPLAAASGVRITAYRIGSAGDLVDVDGDCFAKLGISSDGAVLIRPTV